MGLSEQLEELQRQRAAEVRNLHCTYLRTKRELHRAASPTRFVRKHLTVCLAAGAALGLMLAPRPAPRPVSEEATERAVRKAHRRARRGISMSWVKRVMMKFVPQAAEFLPDEAQVAGAEEKIHEEAEQIREESKQDGKKQKKSGALASLIKILEMVLPLVASKVDWRSLVNQVMHGVYGKMKEQGSHNGHEPKVSVADAGTVKQQDFEHFE